MSKSSPKDYKEFKCMAPYSVTWSIGREDILMNFELYRGEIMEHVFPNIANVGNYPMKIPSSVKPADNYRLKIVDSENQDEVIFTQEFSISRKIPFGIKAVGAAAVVGTAVYLIINSGPKNNDIADPPMITR